MNIGQYKGQEPVFIPEEYFIGCISGSGGFFNRWGTLKKRFYLSVRGEMVGDNLLLHEDLLYDDGNNKKRVYTIARTGSGRYKVNAEGLVGDGTINAEGNALNWNYVLRQEVRGRELDLVFDDWMFLQHNDTILNRAIVKKFGIRVGEVVLHFKRESDNYCNTPITDLVKLPPVAA